MSIAGPAILRHMVTVADPIRSRMLRILARQELTVSELCAVLQLPQSTVSRHLKTLLDDGWVTTRRDGTSRFYGMSQAELAEEARDLWSLVERQLTDSATVSEDDRRLAGVLEGRRERARAFFADAAEGWDHLRTELFGETFHLQALLGLLDDRWTVGDLGCGTGHVSGVLAPYVGSLIAVDGSEEMLRAAAGRLEGVENVQFRRGELEALPVDTGTLDAAVMMLVLHYVPDPARVLQEAARVLRPGGRLLLVDMLPHEREEYQQRMGHVWLGFSEGQITRYLLQAGFARPRVHPIPPAPEARGPGLFAATAVRP